MKKTMSVAFITVSLLSANHAHAVDCIGEACPSVSIEWKNGCLNIKNKNSSKTVKVVFPAGPGITGATSTVKPGKTNVLKAFGRCFGGVRSPATATFN